MTIVEALSAATNALNNAVANVLGLYAAIDTRLNEKVSQVQTIIYNFDNRSAYSVVYVDEVNGSEANNGLSIDTPKKLIDNVIDAMGLNATEIRLLSDCTWRRKGTLNANLILNGVQKSAAAPGFIPRVRRLVVQGIAENSPQPGVGTFCAGAFCYAGIVTVQSVDIALQDVPSDYAYRGVFAVQNLTSFVVYSSTLTVSSPQAGSVFSTILGKITASLSFVLGSGAAGHVFDGVAAGANPNNSWKYDTNITSA